MISRSTIFAGRWRTTSTAARYLMPRRGSAVHSLIRNLAVEYAGKNPRPAISRAFARLSEPGTYASSIARPRLFRDYLIEQLEHLNRDYEVSISVGRSASEIPYAYVIEDSGIEVGDIGTAELSRLFPSNELVHIGDEVADGIWTATDSRARSRCSTGRAPTSASRGSGTIPARRPEHFQQFRPFHQLRPLRR